MYKFHDDYLPVFHKTCTKCKSEFYYDNDSIIRYAKGLYNPEKLLVRCPKCNAINEFTQKDLRTRTCVSVDLKEKDEIPTDNDFKSSNTTIDNITDEDVREFISEWIDTIFGNIFDKEDENNVD